VEIAREITLLNCKRRLCGISSWGEGEKPVDGVYMTYCGGQLVFICMLNAMQQYCSNHKKRFTQVYMTYNNQVHKLLMCSMKGTKIEPG